MSTQHNIPTYEEIARVIRAFYGRLTVHPQLGHFFEGIENFSEHEQRIIDFWFMAMGGKPEPAPTPKIDMIGKHFPLGITEEDLQIWLALFTETLAQEITDEKARYWLDKAMTIAARLKQIVIDHQAAGVQLKP